MHFPRMNIYSSFRQFLAGSVLLALVEVCAWADAPDLPQVWIAAEAAAFGTGESAEEPLDGSSPAKLERIMSWLYAKYGDFGSGVRIHFLEGTYETGGINIRPRWWIEGAGMEKTVIKRVATNRDAKRRSSHFSVIGGGWISQTKSDGEPLSERDFADVRVAHMTLDANWSGLKQALGSQVKKAAALSLFCRTAEVAHVKAIHHGAWGGRTAWREVFPIIVRSMAKIYPEELTGPPSTDIEIHHCVVEGKVGGPDRIDEPPYCTGIMIGQEGAASETGAVRAHVHDNIMRDVTNGIGFGGAWTRNALFENNEVINCLSGFNFDTGGNRNVVIRNNVFKDVISGGTIVFGANFVIEDNEFNLRYDVPERYKLSNSALRIQDYTTLFVVRNNQINLPENTLNSHTSTTAGIRIFGRGVGFTWEQDSAGRWRKVFLRHTIVNNDRHHLLRHEAISAPGRSLHIKVDGQDVDLNGGTFTW